MTDVAGNANITKARLSSVHRLSCLGLERSNVLLPLTFVALVQVLGRPPVPKPKSAPRVFEEFIQCLQDRNKTDCVVRMFSGTPSNLHFGRAVHVQASEALHMREGKQTYTSTRPSLRTQQVLCGS